MPPKLKRDGARKDVVRDISGNHFDGASHDLVGGVVDGRITDINQTAHKLYLDKLDAKNMIKPNAQISVLIHVHSGRTAQRYTIVVPASIRLAEFEQRIEQACNVQLRSDRHKLYYFDVGGEVVELNNQAVFTRFFYERWCCLPWVLHIHGIKSEKTLKAICHDSTAKILFNRYDVNGNGKLERWELYRLLNDLGLENYDLSPALVKRYVEGQFQRLDVDGTDAIGLEQFVMYIADMTRWMRTELMVESHQRNIFEVLAARTLEAEYQPAILPIAFDDGSGASQISTIDTGLWGIRLEIPQNAQIPGAKISVRTLNPHTIRYLSEGMVARDRGEFAFSPVVRVDYPAFEDGEQPPELRAEPAPPFDQPLTLIMPHCFDVEDGKTTSVFLGAPHGATQFERLSVVSERGESFDLRDGELRVPIPYAGTFCAFSSLMIDGIAAVRFHVYAHEQVPREGPATLRVHICPTLPDHEKKMHVTESSQWGVAKCAGSSPVLYLCKGARFKLRYDGQEKELQWHGAHVSCELKMSIASRQGVEPTAGDSDSRELISGAILVDVLEGEGKRASKPKAVAARAGMSVTDYKIAFTVRLKDEVRPVRRPSLRVKYRTQNDFTLAWRAPRLPAGDAREITHYSIELATTDPGGTYYPWKELWCGAGHVSPDFDFEGKVSKATKNMDTAALALLERTRVKEKLDEDEIEAALDEEAAKMLDTKVRMRKKTILPQIKSDQKPDDEAQAFFYTLRVDPTLFGKVRLRYWLNGDRRPSFYSDEVSLPRFKGISNGGVDAATQTKWSEMRRYFEKMTNHVTDGGKPLGHRIGNETGLNKWGGDSMPQRAQQTDKEKRGGVVMAPVPYDVPRVSAGIAEVQEAGATLARFYRDMGVNGGGGGLLCGLSIDHVIHAIIGTPTTNGQSSPSRTVATLQQPLMAFLEVAFTDILLPMLDTVVGVSAEWQSVHERMDGIIQQTARLKDHYVAVEPHVRQMVEVLVEAYETLMHCQEEQALTFHLKHEDYSKELKRDCAKEVIDRVRDIVWRLSTELLEMLLIIMKIQADAKAKSDAAEAMRAMPARLLAVKGFASKWHVRGARALQKRKEEEAKKEAERVRALTSMVVSEMEQVPFARAKVARNAANEWLKLKKPVMSQDELAGHMVAHMAAQKAKAKFLERAELAAIERNRDHMVERQLMRQKTLMLVQATQMAELSNTSAPASAPKRRRRARLMTHASMAAIAFQRDATASDADEDAQSDEEMPSDLNHSYLETIRRQTMREEPPSTRAPPPSARAQLRAAEYFVSSASESTSPRSCATPSHNHLSPVKSRQSSHQLRNATVTSLRISTAPHLNGAVTSPRLISTGASQRHHSSSPPRRLPSTAPRAQRTSVSNVGPEIPRFAQSLAFFCDPIEARTRLVLEAKNELLQRVEAVMQYFLKAPPKVAPKGPSGSTAAGASASANLLHQPEMA